MSSSEPKRKSTSLKSSQADGSSPTGDITQLLTLSLFIVLLAFFIVLSSSYSFDRDKVEDAMDSINAAFGAHIFSSALSSPSMQEDEAQKSGSGFSDRQDFRSFMQDSFQGFDLRMKEVEGEKMIAMLEMDKQEFYRHFKYLSRTMGTIYAKRNGNDVAFHMIERSAQPTSRRQILNLSKMAIRTESYGIPVGVLNIIIEESDAEKFAIEFIFEEAPS